MDMETKLDVIAQDVEFVTILLEFAIVFLDSSALVVRVKPLLFN
jgi:hypothetical protein